MAGLGRVQSTKKYENQISRTDRRIVVKPVFDSDSPSPDFKPEILKNWREKHRRHFPNHAPKKVVKRVKVVFRPEKTRRHPHRLRHLHLLSPGRFEKLSVFSRPALSRRHGKSPPPHQGPAHNKVSD